MQMKNAYVMFMRVNKRNNTKIFISFQHSIIYIIQLHYLHNSMKFWVIKKLPNAEMIANQVISFPHHQHLTKNK